jgi:hypothetical protein
VNVRSTFCTPLVAVAIVLSCFVGCSSEVEPKIVAGVDACRVCNMVIDRPREACGYIHSDEFVTFDSPVCLLRGYEALHRKSGSPPERVWFADYNEGTLHPAESMTFLMTDRIATAMESGVLIFAEPDGARTAGAHPGEVVTDWDGFRLLRGEPDRTLEVSVGVDGMVPEVVEAEKGELLMWHLSGTNLEQDLVVSLVGYPEVGSVVLPASGEKISFRMRAERPGDGFPILGAGGEALGRLRVRGAHTVEEEAM